MFNDLGQSFRKLSDCSVYVKCACFTVYATQRLALYLNDLCVCVCVCVLCIFYMYMGQVPEIKLTMMIIMRHPVHVNDPEVSKYE